MRKIVCSYPRSAGSVVFEELYAAGRIELELVPQGTLSERMRAAGAGIGGFFTPTAAGTKLAEGKESRMINGREYILEQPLKGNVALIKAEFADRWGNLTFRFAGEILRRRWPWRRINTVQARRIVDLGVIPPEQVMTPGIFVDRIVEVSNPVHAS